MTDQAEVAKCRVRAAVEVRSARPEDAVGVRRLVAIARHRGGSLRAAALAAGGAASIVELSGQCVSIDPRFRARQLLAWVATCAGCVVGFASAAVGVDTIQLLEVIVASRFRRRGIGSDLLVRVMDLADSYEIPLVALVRGTDCDGLRWLCARDFYPALREDGTPAIEPDSYASDGCDGLLLVRLTDSLPAFRIAR